MTALATADPEATLLTPAEERSLAYEIEAGVLARAARVTGCGAGDATSAELRALEERGERARQRFIAANLGLVGMVTRQALQRGERHGALGHGADLYQEGCLGLIRAVERFDVRRGHRFSTYALFWIRQHVGAATARQLGALNLPTSRAEQLRAARGVETTLTQQLGRTPEVGELAQALGRSESWTADLLHHQAPQSLDASPLEAFDLQSLPTTDAPERWERDLDGWHVEDLLWRLDDLSRRVLRLRLGFEDGELRSFTDTARVLRITVTRVRRIEARALEALRAVCPQQACALL